MVAVVADLIVRVAFGTSWSSAVTPLRILSITAAVDVVAAVAGTVFLSRKEMSAIVGQQTARLGALALGLVAVPFVRDTRTAAFAVLFSGLVGGAASTLALRKRRIIGAREQAVALTPVIVPTLVMAAVVTAAHSWLDDGLAPILELVALGALGAVAYAAVGLLLFRSMFLSFGRRGLGILGIGSR